MKILDELKLMYSAIRQLPQKLESIQLAIGRIEARQTSVNSSQNISESEFQAFSQWGEDGIIQNLINHIPIENKIFVEFGVENYTQSNTRFLIKNNNWSGLIIDGSAKNIEYIKRDPIYWQYNLKAVQAFIDKDNINKLLISNGLKGDIGLLSIDIDGNDYWVWEAITAISPRIVICEYNSRFGSAHKLTVPYDKSFVRSRAHYSNLYYGASIAALVYLAHQKGYQLMGGNRAGNNLFFARNDVLGTLLPQTIEQAYVKAQFREALNNNGELAVLDWSEGLGDAGDLPIFNIDSRELIKLNSLELNTL